MVTVSLHTRDAELQLSESVTTVPAGVITLQVGGNQSRSVRFDGRDSRLPRSGLVTYDFTRSTGYHRLDVDGQQFWFATQDRKLSIEGIAAMLSELVGLGTGWSGQAMFSDGSGFRDPHVLYAWLDGHADEALDVVDRVLLAPRSRVVATERLSRRAGAGVRRDKTLRLLRSDPRRYLSERAGGVLTVGDREYDPARVVRRSRTNSIDTIANRRVVLLLNLIARAIAEVLDSPVDSPSKARLRLLANRAGSIQQRPIARTLRQGANLGHAPRQAEELDERRYRRVYELYRDLSQGFGWSPSASMDSRLSYVRAADDIYQAYAASRIAAAFDLTQTAPILGSSPLAFTGPEFDLYYDAHPPSSVLTSWRFWSSSKDEARPDLTLCHRATGHVAVLDVKYRVALDGTATEDSRKDVTSYMGLYGLQTVGVVYPGSGDDDVRQISAEGHEIVEVSLIPGRPLSTDAVDAIRSMLRPPTFPTGEEAARRQGRSSPDR